MSDNRRFTRLRPEFAHLYPALSPGEWEPAADVGSRLLLWQLQQPGTQALGSRLLDSRHFEFRGGGSGERAGETRTRREDQPV
jgi:hypothetical protein